MGNTPQTRVSSLKDEALTCDWSNRELDQLPRAGKSLKNVKNLNLSHNNLLVIENKSLGKFLMMTIEFRIAHKSIDPILIHILSRQFLHQCHFFPNPHTNSSKDVCKNLEVLDLSHNSLISVKCSLPPNLRKLNLSSNSLFADTSFSMDLPGALVQLDISHCQLGFVPVVIATLSNLEELNLSYNCLKVSVSSSTP